MSNVVAPLLDRRMRTILKSGLKASGDRGRSDLSVPVDNLPALWIRTRNGGLLCCPIGPRPRGLTPEDERTVLLFLNAAHHHAAPLALLAVCWVYADRIEPLEGAPAPEWTRRYVHDHFTTTVKFEAAA